MFAVLGTLFLAFISVLKSIFLFVVNVNAHGCICMLVRGMDRGLVCCLGAFVIGLFPLVLMLSLLCCECNSSWVKVCAPEGERHRVGCIALIHCFGEFLLSFLFFSPPPYCC